MKKKQEIKSEENKEIKFYTEELKKSKNINEDTVKIISFIVILIVVGLLLFGLFYINGKFVSKDKYQGETTTTTTEAMFDETLTTVDTMFNLSKDVYYVLAYDQNDPDGKLVYDKGTAYSNPELKLYKLDLTNAMNKMYYNKDKASNLKASKAKEMNFTTSALLIFKNGKIDQAITDKDEIAEKLNMNR